MRRSKSPYALLVLIVFAVWSVLYQHTLVEVVTSSERTHAPLDERFNRPSEEPPRVFCVVPSLYTPNKTKVWDAILATWGPRCDTLKFFIDAPVDGATFPKVHAFRDVAAEIVHVPMVRNRTALCQDGKPCKHIWEKMWRTWVHVLTKDPHFYTNDFFVKVDDDGFFFPSHLRDWLVEHDLKSTDEVYAGHWIGQFGNRTYDGFVAGATVVLSKKTLTKLVPVLLAMEHEYGPRHLFKKHGRCVDRDGATEELVTRKCLAQVGIAAQPMRTVDHKELVVLYHPARMLCRKRSGSWYWANKPSYVGESKNCCSDAPVTLHDYKQPQQILDFENLLFDPSNETLVEARRNTRPKKDEKGNVATLVGRRPIFPMAYFRELDYLLRVRESLLRCGEKCRRPTSSFLDDVARLIK